MRRFWCKGDVCLSAVLTIDNCLSWCNALCYKSYLYDKTGTTTVDNDDVKCCLSVLHLRVSNPTSYAYLSCCLTTQKGVSGGVERSTYIGRVKLQASPKPDY